MKNAILCRIFRRKSKPQINPRHPSASQRYSRYQIIPNQFVPSFIQQYEISSYPAPGTVRATRSQLFSWSARHTEQGDNKLRQGLKQDDGMWIYFVFGIQKSELKGWSVEGHNLCFGLLSHNLMVYSLSPPLPPLYRPDGADARSLLWFYPRRPGVAAQCPGCTGLAQSDAAQGFDGRGLVPHLPMRARVPRNLWLPAVGSERESRRSYLLLPEVWGVERCRVMAAQEAVAGKVGGGLCPGVGDKDVCG